MSGLHQLVMFECTQCWKIAESEGSRIRQEGGRQWHGRALGGAFTGEGMPSAGSKGQLQPYLLPQYLHLLHLGLRKRALLLGLALGGLQRERAGGSASSQGAGGTERCAGGRRQDSSGQAQQRNGRTGGSRLFQGRLRQQSCPKLHSGAPSRPPGLSCKTQPSSCQASSYCWSKKRHSAYSSSARLAGHGRLAGGGCGGVRWGGENRCVCVRVWKPWRCLGLTGPIRAPGYIEEVPRHWQCSQACWACSRAVAWRCGTGSVAQRGTVSLTGRQAASSTASGPPPPPAAGGSRARATTAARRWPAR